MFEDQLEHGPAGSRPRRTAARRATHGSWTRAAKAGPLGGDLQNGSMVAGFSVKLVIFLRDPLTAHAHDPDIQALLKVCDVQRVPLATTSHRRGSASPRSQPCGEATWGAGNTQSDIAIEGGCGRRAPR